MSPHYSVMQRVWSLPHQIWTTQSVIPTRICGERKWIYMKKVHSGWVGCHWKNKYIDDKVKRFGGYEHAILYKRLVLKVQSVYMAFFFGIDSPHSSHFNFDFSSRDFFGNSESSRVYDLDCTSYLLDRRDFGKLEGKWIWRIIGNDLILGYVLWRWVCYDKLKPI